MVLSTASLNNIENELIIGLAGGLGVNFDEVADSLASALARAGYHVVTIRIAENFAKRNNSTQFGECYWKMQYGTKQRQIHGNDFWARKAIEKIFFTRPELSYKYKKIAYLVRSLKNREELELLSTVYGRNFVSIAIYSDAEATLKYLEKKLRLRHTSIEEAQREIAAINSELQLGAEMEIRKAEALYLEDTYTAEKINDSDTLARFLIRKDQEETHPDLKRVGQNLFKCYSIANYFIYQDANLTQQIHRFLTVLFNDPFAEPTFEEYFMFCAQAAAYRSLDLDRQVGAVIVNKENELVASGFNDVSKVGGGHFAHHDHPLHPRAEQDDQRDFKQPFDFNHIHLDQIAKKIADRLHLSPKDQNLLRDEISGITEYKRSTHAEMSALLDAARRGIAVRDCTMYINTYPCHTCTKHIIAAGVRKVVFLHPYTKSKAREMYKSMIRHGLLIDEKAPGDAVVFEPFLGVSPNRFMQTFANDKETRLEKVDGKETGRPVKWLLDDKAVSRKLIVRPPHSYISREWVIVHNKTPDISVYYKPGFIG
ncbi:MAG TPA: deaminase [Gammaproteobacteria bacterium]|nr:deaminase [Gammaproteobacteria bacterium]